MSDKEASSLRDERRRNPTLPFFKNPKAFQT